MVNDRSGGNRGRGALRVLAADDSAVMREVLRMVFAMHASGGDRSLPAMELCGTVSDGIEALDAVRTLRPDVLLLDLEMPHLGGLGVLERLKVVAPSLPVIMCSAHTERGARVTLDALALGAKDYVMKPAQQRDFAAALDALLKQLLPKIAALAGPGAAAKRMGLQPKIEAAMPVGERVELVAIGVSTGGPSALETLLPALPRNFAVPIMIVQHMPRLFTGALAERLNRLCQMPVMLARDGASIAPGQILLAPGDAHLEVAAGVGGGGAVHLHQGPARNSCKPSVDYLFDSAAKRFGAGVLGVVMTGMGSDGLDGAKSLCDAGGMVLVQDEASSAVWGMPGRVAAAGLAAAIVPLDKMADAIRQRVNQGRAAMAAPARLGAREGRMEAAHGLF